jgi:polyisoprenoid-binding protein YceI
MNTETTTKTTWALDPAHSEIQFKVKHLMITTVTGHFGEFEGNVETDDEDFGSAVISFRAKTASINTNSEQRDGHLKSDDFFASEKYPWLSFTNGRLTKTGDNEFELSGEMTIRDVTKPVNFKAELGGIEKDPWGNQKAGFSIEGKINRKDFGLTWNAITESGGMLVSEDVKILAEVQLVKA